MRRWPIHNMPAFFWAEGQLERAGWRVLNPAKISTESWKATRPHRGNDPSAAWRRRYAAADLAAIMSLDPARGDAVVVLKGWSKSKGARAEVAVARWLRVPVITLAKAVREGRRCE